MRKLPDADPGEPDIRSATHFLSWVVRRQFRTVLGLIVFGIFWMVAQALLPFAIGKAIDDGVAARDIRGLMLWTGMILALGVAVALTGMIRHRFAVTNWLTAAYRTVQLTGRQATRLGATLPKRLATGEVVSVGNSDVARIGSAIDVLGRACGGVVAILLISVIMLTTSVPLGLLILIGVPLLTSLVAPLFRPLHRRQSAQRELYGALTSRANDIVAGLRVLRGVGGERSFADIYRSESQRVRHSGVRVARVQSVLEALQYFIPGIFLVGVTWFGARQALAGEMTAGQLVSFYGYAAFLVAPMRTLTEAADKWLKAHVAAGRVVHILALEPEVTEHATAAGPTTLVGATRVGGALADPVSGCVIIPGVLTALVASTPEDATTVVDRLGRYVDSDVTWGGNPLAELPLSEVRERVLVADNDARIFAGRLRVELTPTSFLGTAPSPGLSGPGLAEAEPSDAGLAEPSAPSDAGLAEPSAPSDAELAEALRVASATDIVDALPAGLDETIAEQGRSFSGGQRQRLRLARALLADPEVLLLVEPTSAVDAHTEARIADRLRSARVGRTTVVCTTSPLMLAHADRVLYIEDGKVFAEGSHAELLAREPRYRATVTRGEA